MKRVYIAVLIAVMTISITACGKTSDNTGNSNEIAELKEEIEALKKENAEIKAKIGESDSSSQAESDGEDSIDGSFVAETSGVCGPELTWEYGHGILKIHGIGDMSDFPVYGGDEGIKLTYPWGDVAEKVNHIIIDDGCTYIGGHAFDGFVALSKIVIPDSVKEIQDQAFHFTPELNIIEWGEDKYVIETKDKSTEERIAQRKTVVEQMNNDGHLIKDL